MEFKKVFISELKPAEYNPRKDLQPGDPEYERIKASIEEFGYVDPVIINSDHTVIGGHQRVKVLQELGHTSIDVVVVDLDKTREKALNVALNKITGEWDLDKLSGVMQEIQDAGELDITVTGFTDAEIASMLEPAGVDPFSPMGDEAASAKNPKAVAFHEVYEVIVECENETQQQETYERLLGDGFKCRVLTL